MAKKKSKEKDENKFSSNINELDALSYAQFLQDRINFRKSGKSTNDTFNTFDSPGHKFFKILFYFGSENNDAGYESNGLLHPTWSYVKKVQDGEKKNVQTIDFSKIYDYNSAWSFLKINDENERADKLEKFITLLSNINTHSPWYFTSIGGLDAALERNGPDAEKFEVGERKKLTITCLPDAFDNRISTLLDLYRDITWSWSQKKQILPSNLKKFDMAIYIFESPVHYWHDVDASSTTLDHKNNILYDTKSDENINNLVHTKYVPSYKMIEFHDCEFSYNSSKTGWNELNNQTGFNPTFAIEISYGDCYEVSYNEHLMRAIGDVIKTDTYQAVTEANGVNVSNSTSYVSYAQMDNTKQQEEVSLRRNGADWGFLGNALAQGVGLVTDYAKEKLTRAVLGNLYTYSLTKIGTQLDELSKGNLIKAGQSIKQYIDEAKSRNEENIKQVPTGNIGVANNNSQTLGGEINNVNVYLGEGKKLGNIAYSGFVNNLHNTLPKTIKKISPSSIANN